MNKTNISLDVAKVPKELRFVLFVIAVAFILWPARVDAATINVATGTSDATSDSICQLDEAIENINNGTRTYADCVETGTYGSNDVINLPTGTITGSGSGFLIQESVKIVGRGKGATTVTGKDLYLYGGSDLTSNFTLQDFTVSDSETVRVSEVEHAVFQGMEIKSSEYDWIGIEITESERTDIINSHIHGTLNMGGSGFSQGVVARFNNSDSLDLNIENTTIDHLSQGIALSYEGSAAPTSNLTVKNSTITDIAGTAAYGSGSGFNSYGAIGIMVDPGSNDSQAVFNYTTINNTFSSSIADNNATAIFEVGRDGDTINHTAQNDLYAIGDGNISRNYYKYDEEGSPTFTTTSNGGNVSSDGSLGSTLNKPTDKHNLTTLASFLGVLQDNGGPVPTLAILEGSPAIDAGTSVLGLATDARGNTRTLGAATDAGAFESTFGNAAGAGNKLVPGVPDTGFGLLKNNPLVVLVASIVSSMIIYVTARKYKLFKK